MKRNELIKLISSSLVTHDHWRRISNVTLIGMGAKGWCVYEEIPHNQLRSGKPPFVETITIEDVFPHVKPEIAPTIVSDKQGEDSGGSVEYYKCPIRSETTEGLQSDLPDDVVYIAECNDIIEALNMTYAEANIFKEVWRSAAARTLGKKKAGHTEIRGADKICFFGERNRIQKGGK